MSIQENVDVTIRYKPHTATSMTANTLLTPASDPATSGGQLLRRVSMTLTTTKNTYTSNEVNPSRMVESMRHGTEWVAGALSGELSCGTYFDLLAASHRHAGSATFDLTPSQLTSITANATASTLVAGGGDPVSLGLRVGDIIQVAGTVNSATKFLIRGFSGTNNRTMSVYPAPTGAGADTSFTLTRLGSATHPPTSSHVNTMFLFEEYFTDADLSRLFQECVPTGYRLSMPATGIATTEINFTGRKETILTGGSAPFFASPTAATTTPVVVSTGGVLFLGGSANGVLTALEINTTMNTENAAVIGQTFLAGIIRGRIMVSGTFSAYFENSTILENFLDEDEVELLVLVGDGDATDENFISVYMPTVKLTSADVSLTGEGGVILSAGFTALRLGSSITGAQDTAIRLVDTAA